MRIFLIQGFRLFDTLIAIVLTCGFGHDIIILKMPIFDEVDYIDNRPALDQVFNIYTINVNETHSTVIQASPVKLAQIEIVPYVRVFTSAVIDTQKVTNKASEASECTPSSKVWTCTQHCRTSYGQFDSIDDFP